MKKTLTRILTILVVLSMLFALAACGNKTTDVNEKTATTTSTTTATADSTKTPEVVKINLTLWDNSSAETDPKFAPRKTTLDGLTKTFPNITVETNYMPDEAYKTKVKVAAAANELPDIYFMWGGGTAKPTVNAGLALPLDEYLTDDIKSQMVAGGTTNFTYGGKVYGLPYTMWAGINFCNKELFEKNGVKIPETWSELLTAVKAFKAKGITPMAVGEKDLWPGMFFQNILAIRTAGADYSNKALDKQVTFDTPEMADSGNKLLELINAGAFNVANMGQTNNDAEAEFVAGKAAMFYQGSWWAGTFDDAKCPIKGKVVSMNFPAIEGAKGDGNAFLGGCIDTYMVNTNTKMKDETVKYYLEYVKNLSKNYFIAGSLPGWKHPDVDASKLGQTTQDIVKLTGTSTGFVLAWNTFLEGKDADTHMNLVAELFGKKITGEAFAKEMQKLNEVK